MKTYLMKDEDGKLISFEIPNWKVSRNRATKIIASISRVKITRSPKRLLSWFREDVFCEFELNGLSFEIEEPFGDNSRFLIGSKQNYDFYKEIAVIEQAFRED